MTREPFRWASELLGEGDCYLAERVFPPMPAHAARDTSHLCRNLQLLRGVGPKTEERLRAQGYDDLQSLASHPRWGGQASELMEAIERRNAHALWRCGAPEADLAGFYLPGRIGFLDIETTGLYSTQPLFLIGIMRCREDGAMLVRQFLARTYDEELAVLLAAQRELEGLGAVATYNGRRFDLPYIRDRMAYHGISFEAAHFHVDLLRVVRRAFRGALPDFRLVTVASFLFGYERHGDIPSALIPEAYHEFVRTRNPALVRPILEHNAMDLHALALTFCAALDRSRTAGSERV